jgi:two-component system phosphate regulon sensor histidine kinase PhoR
VIFHTFFVLVMVIVFGYILYYTKLNIFTTINEMLSVIVKGGTVDPQLIQQASERLDTINLWILCGMVVFASITGVIAAHITLVPTKDEFALRKKFITAVAHELRTPLAVLRTSNEVALYDLDDHESIKSVLIGNIEETKFIANILNNLVIFSRVGAEESLSFELVDVPNILETVIKKLAIFASKHSVTIHYDATPLPQILANATALEQIFYNLIKNAIIYSDPKGGVVTINAIKTNTYLGLTFTDTGIGMSKKNLKHIFEPFFRINPDDSQSASGTGLGLALVFEIMKLHKGIINVESEEGKGTTFTLQFPLPKNTLVQESIPQNNNAVSFSFE